jgi:hypothetical protein
MHSGAQEGWSIKIVDLIREPPAAIFVLWSKLHTFIFTDAQISRPKRVGNLEVDHKLELGWRHN